MHEVLLDNFSSVPGVSIAGQMVRREKRLSRSTPAWQVFLFICEVDYMDEWVSFRLTHDSLEVC